MVRNSGAMTPINAVPIPLRTMLYRFESGEFPRYLETGRWITVQTQSNIVARQLHSMSLVPRPQFVDTQPYTSSSFTGMMVPDRLTALFDTKCSRLRCSLGAQVLQRIQSLCLGHVECYYQRSDTGTGTMCRFLTTSFKLQRAYLSEKAAARSLSVRDPPTGGLSAVYG